MELLDAMGTTGCANSLPNYHFYFSHGTFYS